MGVFDKKRTDVVDFRDEVQFSKESKIKVVDGFIDFGLETTPSIVNSTSTPNVDFLSGLAGASSTPVGENNSFGSFFSQDTASTAPTSLLEGSASSLDLQHLKVKIDDLEYKIDRFLDRVGLIESKIGLFEDKIKRQA